MTKRKMKNLKQVEAMMKMGIQYIIKKRMRLIH